MAEIERYKGVVEQGIQDYATAAQGARQWLGDTVDKTLELARNMFVDEQSEQYPNYRAFIRSINTGSLNVPDLQKRIEMAKNNYQKAINDANAAIDKYGKEHDVSKIAALVKESMSSARPAVAITKDIIQAIKDVENSINPLAEQLAALDELAVEYREVKKMDKIPTEQELIDKLGGGDITEGSCSSLAFAWAANKGGWDVTDFRGGKSCEYFSRTRNIISIIKAAGGIVEWNSGVKAIKKCEIGKEYYMGIGRHATIVRQVAKGEYEYLELQFGIKKWNGWHKLNAAAFSRRFCARGTRNNVQLIDVELLNKCIDYQKLMGYINTASDDQQKGSQGKAK